MRRTLIRDLVDTTIRTVVNVDVAIVTLLAVVPVDEVDLAVGAVLEVDDLRPAIVGHEEVGGMAADEAGALGRGCRGSSGRHECCS